MRMPLTNRAWMLAGVALACSVGSLWSANPALATPRVAVFPIPGTHYNRPHTQITFRGIPAAQIGPVLVVGSKTGVHRGRLVADADGRGASFIPRKRFAPGERVTVGTHLRILGGRHGTFSFTIAHARELLGYGDLPLAPAGPGSVQRFRSAPRSAPRCAAT